jgi:hypothetical protein
MSGDAIGKQTETLTCDRVLEWYPNGVRGFEGSPGAIIPRYVGNKRHKCRLEEIVTGAEHQLVSLAEGLSELRR